MPSRTGGGTGLGDDDRLPWLESVEEDYAEGPSLFRILLLAFLALAVVGAAAFGWWWYQQHQAVNGNGELIRAPEGDYKVKPDDPAAPEMEGMGEGAFNLSQGGAGSADVSQNSSVEAPVPGQPAPAPTAALTRGGDGALPVPERGAPLPVAGAGSLIQLGSFPDEAGATGAWERLSRRHPELARLGKSIERVGDGYRLRVNAGSNAQAKALCARIEAAGGNCYIAN